MVVIITSATLVKDKWLNECPTKVNMQGAVETTSKAINKEDCISNNKLSLASHCWASYYLPANNCSVHFNSQ